MIPGVDNQTVLLAVAFVVIAVVGLLLLWFARRTGVISKNRGFVDEGTGEATNVPQQLEDESEPEQRDDVVAEGEEIVDDVEGDQEAIEERTGANGPTTASAEDVQVIDDVDERQLSAMAPEYIVEDEDHHEFLKLEDTYVRSYFIDGWPDTANDAQFESIFTETGADMDVSIQVEPIPQNEAMSDLKDRIRDMRSEEENLREAGQHVDADDIARKRRDYEDMRDTIRDTDAEMVDVSMYLSLGAPTEGDLSRVSDEIETLVQKTGLNPILKTKDQERTLRSTTPIQKDELEKKRSMMGGAVGAMMPFSSGTLIQEEGIPIGEHAHNASPIIYDRFSHDQGYNMLTIGNIGAGKSFSSKLHLLRHHLYDPDTIIVMLDPLQGFAGLCSALDGEPITVGGNFGLNPLEIKEPPEHVKDNPRVNPGKAKLKDLRSFWESFFKMRGMDLGDRWNTLERAQKIAYRERGIDLDNEDTHHRDPPTIREDIIPILLDMVVDPQEHSIITDIIEDNENLQEVFEQAQEVTQEEQKRAAELLLAMEPFLEGGSLSNLGGESDFGFRDNDVVWLDLQQQESRGGLGLMMNLLFSGVYERAKQSDKKIVFAIDEAKYIMRDKSALEFLEHAVRHSRHYDLSIQFITQTVDEFFEHEEAEAIASQCDHRLFFQIEKLDAEVGEKVDMNAEEIDFVRTATPGEDERGYSEAAFYVSGKGWYPVHIRANDHEAAVVDLEPGADVREALPGMDESEEVPQEIQEIREELLEKVSRDVQIDLTPEQMVPEVKVINDEGDEEYIVDQSALRGSDTDIKEVIADALEDMDVDEDDDVDGEESSEDGILGRLQGMNSDGEG